MTSADELEVRHRYEIQGAAATAGRDLDQLRRAFARMGGRGAPGIEVSAQGGCILVVMRVAAPTDDARRRCEQMFTAGWYDAFGTACGPHLGRFRPG
jgi:hypothetical protein